jgi:hypothetical protein
MNTASHWTRFVRLDSGAARNEDGFAGDPARILGGEEGYRECYIFGLSGPAEWRTGDGLLFEITAHDARRMGAFRYDQSGIDGVDTDLARTEFLRERFRNGVNSALRRRIYGTRRRRQRAHNRTDVNDASTFLRKQG